MERGVDTIEDYYYLLKKYNLEINYQKLFNVACGYDLNIVKYYGKNILVVI